MSDEQRGMKYFSNSVVEVEIDALKQNLSVLDDYLAKGIGKMAVVKADAYGHGAVEVSKAIRNNVAGFAVNDVNEGIELREAGIDRPILVFGTPSEETAPVYPYYDLTATVSDTAHFRLLEPGTEYHLNFDTGMLRLGLPVDRVDKIKMEVDNYTDLECTGIYSHFATADESGSEKAAEQLERFHAVREQFGDRLPAHMSNTGGTAFYPGSHFDMVRLGIGLYGYKPGREEITGLRPVLSWKTNLIQVKPIQKGQTVSYGANWSAPGDGYLGVISAGYEEGVPRILTGNLEVAINGVRYPVVGTVTMNYCMIYLGEDRLPEGSEVELLGGDAMDAEEWAEHAETIPYEILTGISDKVRRIYW